MFFKYLDPAKYRSLLIINGGHNRMIEDFGQVTEDKIEFFYPMKLCIYSTADEGKQLFSKQLKKLDKLIFIENKYVMVYFLVDKKKSIK